MYCFFVQWNWVSTVPNYAVRWYSCTQFFCMQMSGHFHDRAALCLRRWCQVPSGWGLGQAHSWSGCIGEETNLCPIWEWTVVIHAIILSHFCTSVFLKLLFTRTREFLQSYYSLYQWQVKDGEIPSYCIKKGLAVGFLIGYLHQLFMHLTHPSLNPRNPGAELASPLAYFTSYTQFTDIKFLTASNSVF